MAFYCKKCNKRLFFWQVKENGLCASCAVEQKRIEKEEQELLAIKLEKEKKDEEIKKKAFLEQYNSLKEVYDLGSQYSCLYNFYNAHVSKGLTNIFIPNATQRLKLYKDSMVTLQELKKNIHYLGNIPISLDSIEKAFEYIIHDFEECLSSMERFKYKLSGLQVCEINLNLTADKVKRKLGDLPILQCNNITQRTKPDTLKDFIVVDIETTGLKAHVNEIIQLSAIHYESGSPIALFNTFIKPRKGLLSEAQAVNHISEDDVNDAPFVEQVMNAFNQFVGTKLPIVGHNLTFDLRFLYVNGFDGLTSKRKLYDTLELSKKVFDSPSYKLEYLCSHELKLFLPEAHDSVVDCLATGELFNAMTWWLVLPR